MSDNFDIIFSVRDFLRFLIINFAVPSAVFKAIFPVNPSVIITLESPFIILLPSIYPLKIKLSSLEISRSLFEAILSISVPLISSEPTFKSETLGFSFGNNDL